MQLKQRSKEKSLNWWETNPAGALNSHKRSSFDALVTALATKLNAIDASKK